MKRFPLSSALLPVAVVALLAGGVRAGELEIHFIDVGQGASTLILGPDGTRLAKRSDADSIRALREAGKSPAEVRALAGFAD